MEDERNTQYTQGGETQEKGADQVEVRDRGLLGSLLGGKKAPEDQEKKQEEELVSGIQNVKVSEPEKRDEVKKEEHHDHEGGEKKESLLDKLHRSSSSSSSSSDEEEEEEVIDENGEIVKRRKKKGLKEKIKEKLPGRKDKQDVDGEHKPYTPAPAPTHSHQEPEHKPYVPSPPTPIPAHETEYKPNDDHKAYIPATAPPTNVPLTTTHVHQDDNATVVQKIEETPQKGLLEKIKEKLPGGHKKPEDAAAAPHDEEVSSPNATEKKQGLLGKIMDKIPGYNKTPAEEEHKPASAAAAAAGEHKTDH